MRSSGGRGTRPGKSRVVTEELFSETHTRLRGATVFPVEGNGLETGSSIERESGRLPHAGFQHESPNAQCARLRLESDHEAPPEASPAGAGNHIHTLELGRLGIEEPKGTAADWSSLSGNDEKGAAPGSYFLGIQLKVSCARLGIQTAQLIVQAANESAAGLVGQVGASDGERF